MNARAKKIAVVFPGQGSQKPAMLADYYQQSVAFRETFDEAADVLGMNLWQLVSEGSEEDLANTVMTQTVMLTADIAIWRTLQQAIDRQPLVSLSGFQPIAMAGHSLGEFSALVAAEALSFAEMHFSGQLTSCRN